MSDIRVEIERDSARTARSRWVWAVGVLIAVWALSALAFALHVLVFAALLWFVAAVLWIPFGRRITDRIVGVVIAASASVALLAWVSPFLPFLINPLFLTGVLGTVPAIVWVLGQGRRVRSRISDWVSIVVGVLAGMFWYLPFTARATPQWMITLLYPEPDNAAHLGMIRAVWQHAGYEIVNSGSGPGVEAYSFQVYPQGSSAIFAAGGSVITGSPTPPPIHESVLLFASLMAVLAGFLAFVLAWSVDRATRARVKNKWIRSAAQVFVAFLLFAGPWGFVLLGSASFVMALILLIPAAVLAATSKRSPRLGTSLIGLAIIGTTAVYPLLVLLTPVVWIAHLWVTRDYWKARRIQLLLVTGAVAVASLPMLVLLVTRDVDHGVGATGSYDPVPAVVATGLAIGLALVLVLGPNRLAPNLLVIGWQAAAFTFAFSLLNAWQWLHGGAQYYSTKALYVGSLLSLVVLVAVAAVVLSLLRPHPPLPTVPRIPTVRSGLGRAFTAAGALVFIVVSVLFANVPQRESDYGLPVDERMSPAFAWLQSRIMYAGAGVQAIEVAAYSDTARSGRIAVSLPCNVYMDRWLGVLGGGPSQSHVDVVDQACISNAAFAQFLSENPDVLVDVFVEPGTVEAEMVELKRGLGLSNLRIVSITVANNKLVLTEVS